MRPRDEKNKETLEEYAQVAVRELFQHIKDTAYATDKDENAVWAVMFDAICRVGVDVREVNPASVIIYQRFCLMAAAYLTVFPDKVKRRRLRERVKSDVEGLLKQYELMKKDTSRKPFEHDEYKKGVMAIEIIKKTMELT